MTEKATRKPDRDPSSERRRWTPDYIALWVIAVLSLLLNVVVLRQLALARTAARQAIADSITVIEQFEATTISTDVKIDDTVVIETDLPVNETLPVQIKDSFPIDTTVTVPVEAGLLGTLNLTVPIKTTIPVDIKPDVTINQTFHIKAPVPIKLNVPVQIAVGSTGLAPTLDMVKARLRALADRLDASLLPGAAPSTPEVK